MPKKVVYVNFRKRRKTTAAGGFGGSPAQVFWVFVGILCTELLLAAAFYPGVITSTFFAVTVIAVAVAGTLGFQRLMAQYQVSRLHKRTMEQSKSVDREEDDTGRTLH